MGWRKFLAGAKGFSPLVPTQSPIQWVPDLFFRGKAVEACISRLPSVYWQGSDCVEAYFHSPICHHGVVLNWIMRQLYCFNFTCFHSLNTTALSSICHPFLSTIAKLDWRPVAYLSTNTEYAPNETRHRAGIFPSQAFYWNNFSIISNSAFLLENAPEKIE
jgi:hypothetical protein